MCRDILWQLKSANSAVSSAARPSLIDLGPLALLQTALTLLASPLLIKARMGAEIASILLAVPSAGINGLSLLRKSRGLQRSFFQTHRLLTLLIWQAPPLLMCLYAFKQKAKSAQLTGIPGEDAKNECSLVKPSKANPSQNIPAFSLEIQCKDCLQRRQATYDARGYPIYL